MTRPRVLCVSSDRSTRASVTLALCDTDVNVVVAETSAAAVDRLDHEEIDAVVVDASTVANVPGLVESAETRWPGTPTFVHWGEDDAPMTVLTEVIAGATEGSDDELADAVTDRIDTGVDARLDRLVGSVKRRLADATTPGEVERAIRERVTADDRYEFVWIGEYDRGEREVVPWVTDGIPDAWPMNRTFSIGDGDHPVLERTLRTRKLQVVAPVAGHESAVPLSETALERDVGALAVAPLCSDDELYGVLVVYAADRPTSPEREAIRNVAETASYAIESVAVRGQLEQRERQLSRYERLVETAGDGMYVIDEDCHFTTVNDALVEMTGYSREGLLGEHVGLLLDEADVERGQETIDALVEGTEATAAVEGTLETKAGEEIPCETQVAVLTRDGELQGSIGVVRDVTERKRRERRLREQNERLDAFARIVSHDLRNPLGVAQGYVDLMAESESLEHVDRVRTSLDRMETIIADVLAVAQEGGMTTEPETVDLAAIAEEAWSNVSTDGATLTVEDSLEFEADRPKLLRLFENLFRNSAEHGARSDGHADDGDDVGVRIGPLGESDGAGFFVADDGPGIDPDLRDRVFDSEFSTTSGGLGIGLWVVREVADGHGWSVEATESSEGGARFEFDDVG